MALLGREAHGGRKEGCGMGMKTPEEITDVSMEHECIIGLIHIVDDSQLVTLQGLRNHIKDNRLFNAYAFRMGCGMIRKIYTVADYADKRKATNLRRFDFCPECGKAIGWKQIRKDAKEE